jgi:hypothetical protein
LAKSVEVTLVIKVAIDEEYSGADHANDIISTAKKTFAAADVKVVTIDISNEHGRIESGVPTVGQ